MLYRHIQFLYPIKSDILPFFFCKKITKSLRGQILQYYVYIMKENYIFIKSIRIQCMKIPHFCSFIILFFGWFLYFFDTKTNRSFFYYLFTNTLSIDFPRYCPCLFWYICKSMPLHKGSTVMSWILLEDHSSRSRLFFYILVSRHELTTAMQRL